ncbi:encapsulin-associated ferritin-like protein [Parafrankia sp. FMc2]|uniref:encapsulin-associated ferritin-like protein n=1 Tax=Parafrankia sp. FMc2 TaxID=3233196 RepID=UPI0034D59539
MGENSMGLHEQSGALSPGTIDRHRAIASLMEELEAVDWYDQRVEAATDPELAALLAHNRDEEKEHAAMTLEWLRRRDPVLDAQLRTYLFTSVPVTEVEDAAMSDESVDGDASARAAEPSDGSLGIGSLRGVSE